MQFKQKKLKYRSYTIIEVLLTTKNIKLINKKEFTAVTQYKNAKIFIIYFTTLSIA